MNLNDQVEVTLTARGAEIRTAVALFPKVYKEGDIYRDHLWGLMYDFGQYMVMGREPCFKNNEIRILEA